MASQRDFTRTRTLLEACREAAVGAAAYIAARALDVASLDWEEKSRADFVSDVDRGAEKLIAASLRRHFPAARILGEELSPEGGDGDDLAFIVDPLDGTTNFLHGYPQYAVSIAACEAGAVRAGVVHDVPRGIAYHAMAGGGAFAGDAPIRVSHTSQPIRSLIGTGFPFKHPGQVPHYLPQFARLVESTAGVRRAGSAALDLVDVACGRFDGFWELMLAPWDMAAGMLLVREAGGIVTDLAGGDLMPTHSGVVASNGILHDWLLAQVRG